MSYFIYWSAKGFIDFDKLAHSVQHKVALGLCNPMYGLCLVSALTKNPIIEDYRDKMSSVSHTAPHNKERESEEW